MKQTSLGNKKQEYAQGHDTSNLKSVINYFIGRQKAIIKIKGATVKRGVESGTDQPLLVTNAEF